MSHDEKACVNCGEDRTGEAIAESSMNSASSEPCADCASTTGEHWVTCPRFGLAASQRPSDATDRMCPEKSPRGWWCSLPEGHAGDHVAKGLHDERDRWPRSSEAPRTGLCEGTWRVSTGADGARYLYLFTPNGGHMAIVFDPEDEDVAISRSIGDDVDAWSFSADGFESLLNELERNR
jgi:hypothetical protein